MPPQRGGGPISQLQEYVQSDRRFRAPSNRPILQWEYDQRMANAVTLEFRATVSFMVEGVPHHAAGCWQNSKKNAQRDAAERVLGLLAGHWGAYATSAEAKSTAAKLPALTETAVAKLSAFAATLAGESGGEPLHWRCSSSEEGWQAIVDLNLFGGLTHTLQGSVTDDMVSAREDTAERALWYLKVPGYENMFEIDNETALAETPASGAMPAEDVWRREGQGTKSDAPSDAQQRAAEQKTLVMRVQNRLQRMYGKQLPSGVSVWEWSYETSPITNGTIPFCRAMVRVAVIDKEFEGQWLRGQKYAQQDTCNRVIEFLDAEDQKDQKNQTERPTAAAASSTSAAAAA